jgi:lantibiotic modifying enzyme
MAYSLEPDISKQTDLLRNFFIEECQGKIERNGLLLGRAGIIIIQSMLFEANEDEPIKREIENNLSIVLAGLETDPYISSYCDGLAGIGWMFLFLGERGHLDINLDEFLAPLDSLLEGELKIQNGSNFFDILHGSLGIALYFLKRGRHDIAKSFVLHLESSATTIGDGIAWKTFSKSKQGSSEYNLGLAHGNVSILYFLAKCYKAGIMRDQCLALLKKGINFYFNCMNEEEGYNSFFPNTFENNRATTKDDTTKFSRLAWCYGDIGILHTLYIIASAIDDIELTKRTTYLLESTTRRKDLFANKVVDACFCHGSSGIAYIYWNLYKHSKNVTFLDSAKYWTEVTLEYNKKGNAGLDYTFYTHKGEDINTVDLLNGLGGVYLLYDSILNPQVTKGWEEIFFLTL